MMIEDISQLFEAFAKLEKQGYIRCQYNPTPHWSANGVPCYVGMETHFIKDLDTPESKKLWDEIMDFIRFAKIKEDTLI